MTNNLLILIRKFCEAPLQHLPDFKGIETIKSVSAEDMLAAHRVPAILMGIVPQNAGGLGDPIKAAKVFYEHEIAPIQESFKSINEQLGIDVFKFKDYQLDTPT